MKKAIAAVLAALALSIAAWDNHETITRVALMHEGLSSVRVTAKELSAFLEEHGDKIATFLRGLESSLAAELPYYPARPAALAFSPGGRGADLVTSFLEALRVNPTVRVPLYLELSPGMARGDRPSIETSLVDPFESRLPNGPYLLLAPGETVSALDVISTASDEPDFGLDIGLYANNGTAWGARYGFGEQPYGNPNLSYGSQAPFHMAFPAEDPVISAAAAFTRQSLVAMRVRQFSELARFAFSLGEDYWGWRFAGWAAHYVEDLEQPWHSSVMPGKSALQLLWLNATGSEADIAGATTILSNRHLVYEQFVYGLMASWSPVSTRAEFRVLSGEGVPPAAPWRSLYEYDVIAREAWGRGDRIDALVARAFPASYVSDPAFDYGATKTDYDPWGVADTPDGAALLAETTESFRALGAHLRSFVAWLRDPDAPLAPRDAPFDARIVVWIGVPVLVIAAIVVVIVLLVGLGARKRKAAAAS